MGLLKSFVLKFKKDKVITAKRPGEVLQYNDFAVSNIVSLTIRGPICKKDIQRLVEISKKYGKLSHLDLHNTSEIFEISNNLFKGCDSLETVVLPCTILRIGESAFESCRCLKEVVMPESLQTISKSAFYGCSSLESTYIPKGVKTIGNWAFTCNNLSSIKVAPENTFYCTENNILYTHNKEKLIKYPCHKEEGEFNVPEGVAHIACAAFQDTADLKRINIPRTLETIGDRAFFNSSIREIILPEGMKRIGKMAFSHCTFLEKAIIPGTIIELGDRAFTECNKLKEVNVGEGITGIGDNVFANCHSITNIDLPKSAYQAKE